MDCRLRKVNNNSKARLCSYLLQTSFLLRPDQKLPWPAIVRQCRKTDRQTDKSVSSAGKDMICVRWGSSTFKRSNESLTLFSFSRFNLSASAATANAAAAEVDGEVEVEEVARVSPVTDTSNSTVPAVPSSLMDNSVPFAERVTFGTANASLAHFSSASFCAAIMAAFLGSPAVK